jgi:hypothetical protein
LKSIKAGEIYRALFKYFCDNGVPDSLRYDSLNAAVIQSLLAFLQVKPIFTAPRSSLAPFEPIDVFVAYSFHVRILKTDLAGINLLTLNNLIICI